METEDHRRSLQAQREWGRHGITGFLSPVRVTDENEYSAGGPRRPMLSHTEPHTQRHPETHRSSAMQRGGLQTRTPANTKKTQLKNVSE